jgi:hypothetical protein
MKLQDFRTLIREMVEKEMQEMDQIQEKEHKAPKFADKLGKFYVVMHVDSPKADPMMAVTLIDFMDKISDGSMNKDKIAGVFRDSKPARALKTKIMADVKKHRAELDEELASIRSMREEEKVKKEAMINKIKELQAKR